MIEAVVRHGHTEISALKAGIIRIILTKDMTSSMMDQIFRLFLGKSTTLCNVIPPKHSLKL